MLHRDTNITSAQLSKRSAFHRIENQQHVKEINIVLLLPCGKKYERQFKTEDEVVDYLKATHATEAPLSFRHADGSPVLSPALERIYNRVFNGLELRG